MAFTSAYESTVSSLFRFRFFLFYLFFSYTFVYHVAIITLFSKQTPKFLTRNIIIIIIIKMKLMKTNAILSRLIFKGKVKCMPVSQPANVVVDVGRESEYGTFASINRCACANVRACDRGFNALIRFSVPSFILQREKCKNESRLCVFVERSIYQLNLNYFRVQHSLLVHVVF